MVCFQRDNWLKRGIVEDVDFQVSNGQDGLIKGAEGVPRPYFPPFLVISHHFWPLQAVLVMVKPAAEPFYRVTSSF